ncbi:phosphomevalonate kinase [Brevipalpus obovatus]|uniref:phosphomevalonate kinase n=1 Tax=Brevipalpus obovatus TaxID=246614 RepID=UPI003D9DF4FC
MSQGPQLVVIISGKRKCGKDFIVDLLTERFQEFMAIIRIAEPIKLKYSQMHGADFKELLSSGEYKEKHRYEMVRWSEEEKVKRNDPVYFLREAIELSKAHTKPIWILSDARRVVDVEFFNSPQFSQTNVIRIRVEALLETRKNRGWIFTDGIDDAETECGLDHYERWDHLIKNDGTIEDLKNRLAPIIQSIENVVKQSKIES